MSEIGEGEQSRGHTAKEPSKQPNEPQGIPFTFLLENKPGNTEGRKGEPYSSEMYLRVIDNLKQIVLDDINRPEASEHERGVAYTLLMVNLGLQAVAYDHLGAKGQVDFKDDLFNQWC